MKRDLVFSKPLMNAAGMLGFSPNPNVTTSWDSFGAFVTNPISWRSRLPTSAPVLMDFNGGILLHTGLPNPGFTKVIQKYSARWQRADLPVIVHLIADRPEETQRMVRKLEPLDNILAAELGFAPLLADDILLLTLEMCVGELPLIFSLPFEQVLSLGPRLIQNGAAALSLSAPRGSLPASHDLQVGATHAGEIQSGRFYGPAIFPLTLELVRQVARLGLPCIGSGGVWKQAQAEATLAAGALAVQLDVVLWNP